MENDTYIGLDVHSGKISVAKSDDCGAEYLVEVANKNKNIKKLCEGLEKKYGALNFVYEAGPCGYRLYRLLKSLGYKCSVIAPSLIPRKPGEKVKTDKRDAIKLARLHRAGELTAISIPDEEQEALRDLHRAREDAQLAAKRSKQNLNGFLLRYGQRYTADKRRWTDSHFRWLESVRFERRALTVVLDDYIQAVKRADERVRALEAELKLEFETWSQRPICEAIMALRGIDLIVGMGVLLELGDLRRFESPAKLMSYMGFTPKEDSSGERVSRGAITKCGNGHVRRLLVEAAWCARLTPRRTRHWRLRAEQASPAVQELSYKAMKRLHQRFWMLQNRRVNSNKVVVAVARELAGFIWSVAQQAYCEQEIQTRKVA